MLAPGDCESERSLPGSDCYADRKRYTTTIIPRATTLNIYNTILKSVIKYI